MKRHDSGWRDSRLPLVHGSWDVPIPAAGMSLVMVEYDRGEALAVVNYVRRDETLPSGTEAGRAYYALAELRGPMSTVLPFLTVQYDPRNWAMKLFGHNDAARDLIGAAGWVTVTEEHFVRQLYRIRGRQLPNLSRWGVVLSTAPWIESAGVFQPQDWAGHEMSVRRRDYEPEGPGVQYRTRNPCADIDLAIIGQQSGQVALLVDYKVQNAYIEPGHKTHQAMSAISDLHGNQVPSLIVRYDPTGDRWRFEVLCLNAAAQKLLNAFMVGTHRVAEAWNADGWTMLPEDAWIDFLADVQAEEM